MELSPRSAKRLLLLALLLGATADRFFTGRWLGISVPLFVAAGLLALGWFSVTEGRPPTKANLWLGAAALLFAGFCALRDAPVLVALDALVALGLLLLLTAHYRGQVLLHLSFSQAGASWFSAIENIAASPRKLVVQTARSSPVRRSQVVAALPVARGVVLAVPALLGFGGLLMAADSVFASYVSQTLSFRIPLDLASLANHTLVTLILTWLCAGGLVAALSVPSIQEAPPSEGATQRLQPPRAAWLSLGWIEALTVLILVDVLFGSFMLVQGAYFFGGLDTLDRTGMTYASYARRGFFELIAVAGLALALLGLLALLTRRHTPRQRQVFNAASGAMVVLVLGMLVSAFQRMWLYEEAYGFTRLRVYTHSFMVWLAAVLLLFLAALLRSRPRVFVFGSFVTALVYLALLNLANPDALIVRANIARYYESGKLDAGYLASLSADATPDLAGSLGRVDASARAVFRDAFRQQRLVLSEARAQQGWPAWSVARARALAVLDSIP